MIWFDQMGWRGKSRDNPSPGWTALKVTYGDMWVDATERRANRITWSTRLF